MRIEQQIGKALICSAAILKMGDPSIRGKSPRLGETPEEAKSLCLEWIRGIDRSVERAFKEGSPRAFERGYKYGRKAIEIVAEIVDDDDIGSAAYVALLSIDILVQKRYGGSLLK